MEIFSDVIIVGAGLSGLSTAHFLNKLGTASTIIEKTNRQGGVIQTFKEQGFQGEWGPHGFLDNTPESQELLHDIGLYDEAQHAPLGDFHRYICRNGRLISLPQSLTAVLKTPLVSWHGKLRVLADLWKRPHCENSTIADWVYYRFGQEILPLADAAISGTFAGDFTRLSIDAVMPGVRALEKETGSVLRGLIKKKRAASGKQLSHLPAMLNFPEGMEKLTTTLSAGKNIKLNSWVKSIVKDGDLWHIQTDAGSFSCNDLVMALPVNQALKLLASFKAPPVAAIPTAKIVNVVMGLPASARIPYGFGYLAPEEEGRFAIGAMFTSQMFPGRSPKSVGLLEILIGGRRHPERLALSDEEIIRQTEMDIKQLIPIPEPPLFTRVLRPEHGIPQLEMDHPALLEWRHKMETDLPGLHICGFGWDGIGMNDMIKSAKKTAAAVKAGGRRQPEDAVVKPVYF
ncbi:MAG: protoporphyrinogen oxidase [Deltaproteobacteria bacterium]|nr:protoporphyrinogen oxidase [Deltaproteobacteria bacterium]